MTELESLLSDAESTLREIADGDGLDDLDVSEAVDDFDVSETVEDGVDAIRDDDEGADGLVGDLETVVRAIDEAEAVLESIDFSELPDAIDEDEVLEAIEVGEIPAALADSDDAEVVKLRQVIRAINVGKLLGDVDVTNLWEAKRGFDDAVDELTDDREEEGIIGKAATKISDAVDDAGDEDELIETDVDDVAEMGAQAAKADFDLEGGDLGEYEAIIQQQAIEGVDAFRTALLRAHGEFEDIVEFNRERTRNIDRRSNSRNPTAVSTIVTERADLASTPNYATMPRKIRHSNGPTRKHIYGDRFARERKRRGYDDE